jgi:uncharacterized protein (TIGR02246 family)
MKRAALLALALTLSGAVCSLLSPAIARADAAAEIRAAQQSIAAGAEARDLDAIMSNYLHSDKLYVFDVYPPRAYIGWNAFRKDWKNFLDAYKGSITYKIVDMDVDTDGKYGCVHVIEHAAGNDKNGTRMELNIRVTEIYQKIDGKWQIIHEHASVPVDIKTGKADLLSSK